jgi:hypothetical protein
MMTARASIGRASIPYASRHLSANDYRTEGEGDENSEAASWSGPSFPSIS